MPFKLKDDGTIFQDSKGFPIYISEDGTEFQYDVDAKAKQIAELTRAVIENSFANSNYVKERLISPMLAQELFANSFTVRNGKPIGIGENGTEFYGANGLANFDEALSQMVEASPFKDNILKSVHAGTENKNINYISVNNNELSSSQKIAKGLKKWNGTTNNHSDNSDNNIDYNINLSAQEKIAAGLKKLRGLAG